MTAHNSRSYIQLLAMEGCIATGKTTLARKISHAKGWDLLLEDYSEVPSLDAFYEDPAQHAYQTEVEFTKAHFNRLVRAVEIPRAMPVVTDFTLKRDLMFATITLAQQPENLRRYQEFWLELARQIPSPDYVIVLEAPVHELQRRIKARGRSFEQKIGTEYLEQLISGFRTIYGSYDKSPVEFMDSTNMSALLAKVPLIVETIREKLDL